MPIEQYREVALLLLVSIAAVNDLITRRIPNRLLLAGLGCVLVLYLVSPEPGTGLLKAVGGMGAGLAVFLPFYLLRGMAAGDVKLMVVVGAFTGASVALQIAVLTWCAGGVMALFLIVLRGRVRLAMSNLAHMLGGMVTPAVAMATLHPRRSAGSMPYGLAIAVGTIVTLVHDYG